MTGGVSGSGLIVNGKHTLRTQAAGGHMLFNAIDIEPEPPICGKKCLGADLGRADNGPKVATQPICDAPILDQ